MAHKIRETPRPKRKRLGWDQSSETALLHLWPKRLEELRAYRKNSHIYAEMADDLRKLGYTYTQRDVQVKLQNFTQRYRKEKAAMRVSGGSPPTWCHYKTVHQIIGGFEANLFVGRQLESIDDVSNSTTAMAAPSPGTMSESSPDTLMSAPSSPLSLCSLSPTTSEPRKKKKFNFKETILQKFDCISAEIAEHLKKSEENEREWLEIERKKVKILDKMAEENKKLNIALISYLNKN